MIAGKQRIYNILYITVIMLLFSTVTHAKLLHYEKWYQEKHCKGKTEVTLPDRTRCDCVTQTHAIEYDFGNKWSEAIGQSLNYAMQTGKRAGIVLIIESVKDRKYWIRLNSIIQHYKLPIDTWKIEP